MLYIGHRGCRHLPENTLAAFRKALEMGCTGLELDVHRCKSGELVVIHDDTVDRTTDGSGRVAEMMLAELKALNAGSGEQIPTLSEVLDMVDRKATVFIEVKAPTAASSTAELVETYVRKGWSYGQLPVISFDHDLLQYVKQRHPQIHTGATVDHKPDSTEFARSINANTVNFSVDHYDEALVLDAHMRGLKVFVWTANSPAEIERARRLGVDGIMSDYPERLLAAQGHAAGR